jgi:DNA topoisomerase-1
MVRKDGKYILVIVESPGKIKKIESILGNGYKVISSYGHIIDLEKKSLSIDLDNDYEPTYDVIKGSGKFQSKTKVVAELRKLAKDATRIIIASDDDREGEMIGWSYKEVLKLKETDYDRITFNSITKEEVLKAIKKPSKIDIKMTKRIMQYIDEYNSGINMKYDSFVGKSLSVSDINKLYGLSNNKKI